MISDMEPNQRMAPLFSALGAMLMVLGVLLNQWTVGFLFRPSGMYRPIAGSANLLIIWLFQISLIGAGIFLIRKRRSINAQKLREQYKKFSAVTLLLLGLFVFLNLFAYAVSIIHLSLASNQNPVSEKYGVPLEKVYPNLHPDEIRTLLAETWHRPLVYEAYTEFKEGPYRGTYVNVDEAGFRLIKDQAVWPPDPKNTNIFVLGGSTIFGYGVEDDHTIASYLQEFLRTALPEKHIAVYNFGRGFYYSSQERILFERLLAGGFVPDVAIFIDGINDTSTVADEPIISAQISAFFEKENLSKMFSGLPLVSFFNSLGAENQASDLPPDEATRKKETEKVIERYVANKRLVEAAAREFGIRPVFVWQPSSSYKYDMKYHPFGSESLKNIRTAWEYPLFAEYVAKYLLGSNFLYLADIQETQKKPLYIDGIHYSGEFSRDIAGLISDFVVRDLR